MVELLVVAGLLAGIIVAVTGRHQPTTDNAVMVPVESVPSDDLPCPWCGADTHEDDAYCPSCRQPFG